MSILRVKTGITGITFKEYVDKELCLSYNENEEYCRKRLASLTVIL